MTTTQNKKALPYYEEPQTDDQRLFNFQKKYKDGDAAALLEMYELLKRIAYKTINSLSMSNKYIGRLTAEERRQKAHDAATYIIEQYLKRPDFTIKDSITGYLFSRTRKELFYTRKCDTMLVYMDIPNKGAIYTQYKFVVTDVKTHAAITYENLQALRGEFPKLRLDKLRQCINAGEMYKHYQITLLEIEA